MSFRTCLWVLLSVTTLAVLPGSGEAAWFGLRNDTKAPIVVQGSCVVNNVVCPCRPLTLYPGEVAWDSVVQPCLRNVTIYDPKQPKRPLFEKKSIPCGVTDLFFSVQTTAPGQVGLIPATPPMPPPNSPR